jgi:hypothetical protein
VCTYVYVHVCVNLGVLEGASVSVRVRGIVVYIHVFVCVYVFYVNDSVTTE